MLAHDQANKVLRPAQKNRSRENYGLIVLHEPSDNSRTLVDIIFIHGLTSGSNLTWLENTTQTYWPKDLPSHDVPDARIMAFGYNADVTKILGAVSQSNLRDHATTLLAELAAVRDETNSVGYSYLGQRITYGNVRSIERLCLSYTVLEDW